jgi:hypothetical protein
MSFVACRSVVNMDFISIAVAAALLVVLLGWSALLGYLERRRRKEVGSSKPLARGGACMAGRERCDDAGSRVTRQYRRSDGRPLPEARRSRAPRSKNFMSRGRAPRYGFAVVSVLLAGVCVAVGNLILTFPPLILFAAAVAVTPTLAGAAPGLFALVLATLLSDFFFVRPSFVFSLDREVFRLSLGYLLAGLLSAFISKLLSSRAEAS